MLSRFNKGTYSSKELIIYSFYLLLLILIFSKEFLVINEEFLIILSFLAVFFGLQQALSNVLASTLDDRTYQIKKQFASLYENKRHFQQTLITLLEKKIALNNSLKDYQNLLDKNLIKMVENRNLVYVEFVTFYIEQMLSTYLLKYNLELKTVYLSSLKQLEDSMGSLSN